MVLLRWEELAQTPVYSDAADYGIVLPESKFKKYRRGILILGLIVCMVLAGVIGYRNKLVEERNKELAYRTVLSSLNLEFARESGDFDFDLAGMAETEFEYGDTVDLRDLLVDYNGLLTIDSVYMDTETLGSKEYTYTVYATDEYGKVAQLSSTRTFNVVDTKAPSITLAKTGITIAKGGTVDLKANVESVIDEVDGNLVYLEEAPQADVGTVLYGQGWYTVSGDVDTDTVGNYTVTVHAEDIHGLVTEETFTVKVYEPYTRVSISSGTALNNYNTIVSMIMSWGYNRAAAVGIAANAKQESTFNPQAYNSAGYYGIFQWGGTRLTNLRNFCSGNGYAYDSLEGQMAFMKYELSSYGNLISILKSVPDSAEGAATAATSFRSIYERGWMGPVANTARSLYNDY